MITENEMVPIHSCEATTVIDIEGLEVKVKLDTVSEVNVMPKRVYDHLTDCNKKLEDISVKPHGYGCHNILALGSRGNVNSILWMQRAETHQD